jgi:cytidylate kinase
LNHRNLVIAIDGPAASGKSTTARLVAERLGYLHLDTGAMYRAVAAKVIRLGIDPEDSDAVLALLPATRVELRRDNAALQVILDGENVTGEIRSAAVTRAVSPVSSIPGVRAAMVREQRRLGADGGVVLEGRDIGTVVFPDADLKIFLVAGILARAARRRRELEQHGTPPPLEVVVRELEERDRLDSTRSTSPLRKADDAVELDTSAMTIEEQVEEVVRRAKRIMAERGQR